MGVGYNSKIVTDGLVSYLDCISQKSLKNLLTYTDDLTQSSVWGLTNTTVEPTTEVTSPIESTVFKLISNGLGGSRIQQGYNRIRLPMSWTSSIYVKAGTYGFARIGPSTASNADGLTINLNTGEIIRYPIDQAYRTFSVESVGDGWYRISRTRVNDSYTLKCLALYMTDYTGNSDAGAGTSPYYPAADEYIYITGPQFEMRESPTSYQAVYTGNPFWTDIGPYPAQFEFINSPNFGVESFNAISFDGTNDYVDITSQNLSTVATVEMWAKIGVSYSDKIMFGWNQYGIFCGNGNLGYTTGNSDVYGISSTDVSNLGIVDTWTHYVFQMSVVGSYTNSKIYINGQEQTLSQQDSTELTANLNFNFGNGRIAGWRYSNSLYMPMYCSSFKVYNRALTQEEIQQNFITHRGRYEI